MGKPFSVNISRYDPYKTYRFLVYFQGQSSPVAGVSKVTALKRTSEPIEYKEGGALIIRKGPGRAKYEPITLERGVTHDTDFEIWAGAAQSLRSGVPSVSLTQLRRDLRIVLLNEAAQPVVQYLVYQCWVSEYQPLPDLDAGQNAVAIEHIKLENEGWEHDPAVTEPQEQ